MEKNKWSLPHTFILKNEFYGFMNILKKERERERGEWVKGKKWRVKRKRKEETLEEKKNVKHLCLSQLNVFCGINEEEAARRFISR